ncbi:heavy metal translocating P-type ATPase [Gramella sp. BOM4]|nr:heavy metal translocating P-type ATPase [Christiangramia bathymodioli]
MENRSCFHCGDPCEELILHEGKYFCCSGCKTVYDILNSSDLSYYYELEKTPGISPKIKESKFDFLENPEISEKLLEFDDGKRQIVSFMIPSIHCSSCIWILENLKKLHPAVNNSQVDFPRKTIRISFSNQDLSLKELVLMLARIGYEPSIALDSMEKNEKKEQVGRSLIYRLGIAGFAFGNIMFLSFPEYFEMNEFWLERFKHVFRWLMFAFSLPVVFYSGWGYFTSAYKGLRSGILNIDVPIALGIAVLFIRSSAEIILDLGTGFFDSLSGLVFFLLLGKFFQQKTYSFLSFERDYKSYFPIAVTRLTGDSQQEEQVPVYKIEEGDRVIIRNEELIPMDCVVLQGEANIDYSFVTGEAEAVAKKSGDKLFAGGRQQGGIIEVEVLKPVQQSYLTQLWSDEVFSKDKRSTFQSLTDGISRRFTFAVLSIAFIATLFWLLYDPSKALNVFTAVLIIACPCAIALAAPFTLGNLLRIFGKKQLYLKDASVIEQMAKIDTIVFDKTGTLTTSQKDKITYEGLELTEEELSLLNGSLRASNHPLSRSLYSILKKNQITVPEKFEEITGSGLQTSLPDMSLKLGSKGFVKPVVQTGGVLVDEEEMSNNTSVHLSFNDQYKGCFSFQNSYREGLTKVFEELGATRELIILSGDNSGEKERLEALLPSGIKMFFDQKPADKLQFISELQKQGKKVMMVGDGLNDAGALAQSDVGIAISEDINVFSPACDGIMAAKQFFKLPRFMELSNQAIRVIRWSFLLSLCYNLVGLGFAVTGQLMPVVAAILMPLSSISIVAFTSLATQLIGKKLGDKKQS